MTTLFVLVALLIAGGEGIFGFAAALTIGIVIGTYSSIYIAAVVLLLMKITREDLLIPEKETLDLRSLAWISHRFATADADLREIPALRSVRVLDVPLRYACAPERSRALSFRHLRALANANR